MDADTSFELCLTGVVALSAMQFCLAIHGFLTATRSEPAERQQLARPFFVLCVSNVAEFATSLAGLDVLDQMTKRLAHADALNLRALASPAFMVALFVCPLYALVTGWMSFRFLGSKPWRTGREPGAILGQALTAGAIGTWSTVILLSRMSGR